MMRHPTRTAIVLLVGLFLLGGCSSAGDDAPGNDQADTSAPALTAPTAEPTAQPTVGPADAPPAEEATSEPQADAGVGAPDTEAEEPAE